MVDNQIPSIQQVYAEADCLYSESEVLSAINKLASSINQALQDANPLILTVMNGGLVFSGCLLTKMSFPLQVDYVHATRYGDEVVGQTLTWKAKPTTSLAGRTILIIDDILDEGNTLLELMDYCRQQGASKVYSAVLVDKRHDRKAADGLRADFTGLEVSDRFVFGFGMDYKGYWRNAPGIFAVKGM